MAEAKLSRKERKELEAQQAREQAEWDAKYAAKQQKKEIQKLIVEIEKSEKDIIANAAAAKTKGYNDVYRVQLSALKVARARKTQAEKFLFQIDTMEKMKSLSDSSSKLLGSMGEIMNTLGALSLNKDEMKKSQMDFNNAQKNLDQQSRSIEMFFNQMEMSLPEEDDEMMSDVGYANEDLEKEINSFILGESGVGAGSPGANVSQSANDEMEQLRQMLSN
jgi:hypothetical protein